jgi:Spy/CpxP family protein refolding chaperone
MEPTMKLLRRLVVASLSVFVAAPLLWSGVAVTNTALGLTPSASAQGTGGSPGHRRGNRLGSMLANVQPPLSSAQKAQISALRTQWHNQNKAAGQQDRAQRRARFNAHLDQVRGILTPAQRASFDANRAAMRAQRRY